MKNLGKFLGCAALLCAGVALESWTLSSLWTWFVSPLGVRGLNVSEAAGVTLVIAYLRASFDNGNIARLATKFDVDATSEDAVARLVGWCLLRPVFVWAIGFALHAVIS